MKSKIIETKIAKVWMSGNNICYAELLPGIEIEINGAKENVSALKNVCGDKKTPIIIDSRNIKSMDRESRIYFSSEEIQTFTLALAILISSAVSRVIGNFFIGLNKPPYPVKLFTSEEKALDWLKTFVKQEGN